MIIIIIILIIIIIIIIIIYDNNSLDSFNSLEVKQGRGGGHFVRSPFLGTQKKTNTLK